jgi:acyl carrier protein
MTSESAAYDTLRQIFSDVFLRDDIIIKPELTSNDVEGWDSFKQIEIIIACEEHFKIKFKTTELDALSSVGDLATLIVAKTG